MKIIEREHFDQLFHVLKKNGYEIIGPTVEDQAIVYERIDSVDDLPVGVGDEQAPGRYRLRKRTDQALFGYVVGPTSWKKFLFPPNQRLWSAKRSANGFEVKPEDETPVKRAFLGVRACELAAMGIQDKVFTGGAFVDGPYKKRRDSVFLITVNCTEPGGTCFCVSMDTGPRARAGFDLSLTEIIDGSRHYFMAAAGTDAGRAILDAIEGRDASADEQHREDALMTESAGRMGRRLDTTGVKELLYENLEHPQWDKVAERCLSCANCTMVCPTCFCSTVEDTTDLTGEHAERWRKWDSCFTMEFSYIHGGHIRSSTTARYRQWMTHKLASWQDQFGTSGCVGCGRCISWCPVGIDITEEVENIRVNPRTPVGSNNQRS